MIILRSRSLIIPSDEYNLGNDYDTNTATRVFQLDRVMEGIDLANLMFKLDLTYADGTNDTLALDSEVTDDKINLTWTVTKNQLHVPGTVVVQIRALNVDGNMKWSSYIGAFFVEASMFGSADYSGKLTEIEQFEVAIQSEKERVQNEKARQDAEAERAQAEAERKPAEEEREAAEAERKSAETVRSNAETARDSAETAREEWYNSAKANFDAAVASGDKAEQIANSLESNVETNMKAAAASATAAAGSASAAAGSANEAKQYSQNWSSLDERVKKNATDIANTNNNLSKFYPGYYYNGTDTTSDIYAAMPNRSALFFSTNGDQKVGNELGFSKSYQGANVIIWKSSEWRGGALAIPNAGDGILLMAQISGANTLTWKKNEIASKSDLFANNYQTNPDLVATPFAAINGFNSAVTNIPDDAKNTWNSLQTIWLFPNEIGDLTKNRLQIIITGNNTSHRRMYENGKFSDWS